MNAKLHGDGRCVLPAAAAAFTMIALHSDKYIIIIIICLLCVLHSSLQLMHALRSLTDSSLPVLDITMIALQVLQGAWEDRGDGGSSLATFELLLAFLEFHTIRRPSLVLLAN